MESMPSVRGLRKLKLSRVDLVPKGSNPGAHIALFKTAPDESPADEITNAQDEAETSPEETNMSQTETPTPETETPEATAEVTTPEATEVETPEAEVTETPAAEAKPEPVAAGVEKAEAESIRKELDDAKATIAKMQADARKATFIAKAKTEYAPLGDAEQIATLLMKADEHFNEAERDQLHALLSGAAKRVESGDLFAQFGKGDAESESAEDRLSKAAWEMVEKGEATTIEQAKVKAMKVNPELRKDYQESARS